MNKISCKQNATYFIIRDAQNKIAPFTVLSKFNELITTFTSDGLDKC